VTKQYRPWAPEQAYLLPPSPREWLPENHLAFFLMDVVRQLDLSAIEAAIHKKDPRGERPYSPQMMTALLLYAYCVGVFSSRRMERATYEDVAMRVIVGESHPHFTTINGFRLEHRKALADLFLQVLRLCRRAGLAKVQANASKHKAMSYDRMKEEEKRLAAEIEALLRRAELADASEDAEYGSDMRGDELPAELLHRETRLARIRELKKELESEAADARAATLRENAAGLREKVEQIGTSSKARKEAAARASSAEKQADELSPREDDDEPPGGAGASTELSLHRVPATPAGKPKDHAQRNMTDADSRIMVRNGVFMQAYNVQLAVSEDQIIVAHGVTNDGTDANQLVPMLERVRENYGSLPDKLSADNGYLAERNVAYCESNGVDAYISLTKKERTSGDFPPRTEAGRMRFTMQVKLASDEGRAIYERRKVIVEPVFGQMKAGGMRFRSFLLRGLRKVSCEWGFVATCHNLLKLFRAGALADPAIATPAG
jgi:transposase